MIVGVISFIILYFLIPSALEGWLEDTKAKLTGPASEPMASVLDKIFDIRFIRVSEWAGIAALLLCSAISIWKAVIQEPLSHQGRRDATFLAKLIARFLD